MNLSEEEVKEIEGSAKNSEAVAKLWREYNAQNGDAGAQFYKSLLVVTAELQKEMTNISEGKSVVKHRILSSDSQEWKRIFSLLTNSKKIMDGLNQVKEKSGGINIRINETQELEADNIPLTDKMANEHSKLKTK